MSFFIVKLGDNEDRLFNTQCTNGVLLSHIKKSINVLDTIDLATETGEVLELLTKPKEYARKYIEPRSICTIVKVVQPENEEDEASYIPLFDHVNIEKLRVT
ncbi:hypothetical protein HMI56_004506, partial [Coelomomyces lativittatus]